MLKCGPYPNLLAELIEGPRMHVIYHQGTGTASLHRSVQRRPTLLQDIKMAFIGTSVIRSTLSVDAPPLSSFVPALPPPEQRPLTSAIIARATNKTEAEVC